MLRSFLVCAFVIGVAIATISRAEAAVQTFRQSGDHPASEEHKYDYLFRDYRIPATLCVTENQCVEVMIDTRNLNEVECNAYAWQAVEQYRIRWGYDHFKVIQNCVR